MINAPFSLPDTTLTLAASGATAFTVTALQTVVTEANKTTTTGNATLNLTIDSQLRTGSMLSVKWKATGTETLTFGTAMKAPTVTGVAGKTFSQSFIYDGTYFVPCGVASQND